MNKVIYCDIDETITKPRISDDYSQAIPDYDNIAKINKLYDEGHHITYFTARGSRTGIDWHDLTYHQLIEWGAKFHTLSCRKPFYDLIIDDKSKRIEEL